MSISDFLIKGEKSSVWMADVFEFCFFQKRVPFSKEKRSGYSLILISFSVFILLFSYFYVTCLEIKYLRLEREEIYKKLLLDFSSGKIILIKKFQQKQMAANLPKEVSKDWEVMDLDPVTEVKGKVS